MVTLAGSMPLTLAKIGHWAKVLFGRWRAEFFAFQILRGRDAAAFARNNGVWGPVVDDKNGLHRRARIGVAIPDQQVDVAGPHVGGAGGQPLDGFGGCAALVDGYGEPFGLEVALVDGDEERRRHAVDLAIECEMQAGLGPRRTRPQRRRHDDRQDHDQGSNCSNDAREPHGVGDGHARSSDLIRGLLTGPSRRPASRYCSQSPIKNMRWQSASRSRWRAAAKCTHY